MLRSQVTPSPGVSLGEWSNPLPLFIPSSWMGCCFWSNSRTKKSYGNCWNLAWKNTNNSSFQQLLVSLIPFLKRFVYKIISSLMIIKQMALIGRGLCYNKKPVLSQWFSGLDIPSSLSRPWRECCWMISNWSPKGETKTQLWVECAFSTQHQDVNDHYHYTYVNM